MKKVFWIIAILVILIVSVLFLRRQKSVPLPVTIPTPEAVQVPDARFGSESSGVKEVIVSGSEFSFNPQAITVKLGEKVRLTFNNVGSAPHDWTIEGLGIKTKTIGRGARDVIDFTALEGGTFNIYCSVPGHREAGMVGRLVVE